MVKIFFVASEGLKVTHWFEQIIKRIPNAELVATWQDCDIVCVGDVTTNKQSANVLLISLYCQRYSQKPIIMFVHDDPDQDMAFVPALVKSVHFFRTSLLKSQQKSYESLLPSFQCQDNTIQPLKPIPNIAPDKPIKVGFIGAPTSPDRKELCNLLKSDPRFETQFVMRNAFHGAFKQQDQKSHADEFQQNIRENLFQLCCRGTGNFSHRFYEVLASGRVPVLPNTDMVIPSHIPRDVWINCVVMASNVATIPDAIFAFYNCHDMEIVQQNCALMWKTYLSYEGFAPIVQAQIEAMIPS